MTGSTTLERVTRALEKLAKSSGVFSNCLIWLLAAVVTYDVVLRSLGVPNLWAAEVSIYIMTGFAFIGAGATQVVDGHFRVTFLRDMCPPRVRTAMDVFALVLSLLFSIGFTVGAVAITKFSLSLGFRTSTLLQWPMWMLQSLLVIGGTLLSLAVLHDLLLVLKHGHRIRDASRQTEAL